MAFSRASKQAMIFTTEQSESSTFIRMVCQLLLKSSSTGVSRQKSGTVEILVCLGIIFESCMQVSVGNIAQVSYTHRTLSRWILLLLFFVSVFIWVLMGVFLWILIFLSCLNSNNTDSLIKCLDSALANKRRRQWRYQRRDPHSSQWNHMVMICVLINLSFDSHGQNYFKNKQARPIHLWKSKNRSMSNLPVFFQHQPSLLLQLL